METGRWSPRQLVAGVGGILLFISLFLPWFGGFRRGATANGWEIQTTTDVFLLIVAVIAVVSALAPVRDSEFRGMTLTGAAALLGGIATVLLLWLAAFDLPEGFGREYGLYVALVASAVIALGAYAPAGDRTRPPAPSGALGDDAAARVPGKLIVGLGGILLLISLFLPWIGGLLDIGSDGADATIDAWEALLTIDGYFLITAVVALGCALGVTSAVSVRGMPISGAAAVLGGVATLLLAWFLVFDFPEEVPREIGGYLALISASAVAVGGVITAKE